VQFGPPSTGGRWASGTGNTARSNVCQTGKSKGGGHAGTGPPGPVGRFLRLVGNWSTPTGWRNIAREGVARRYGARGHIPGVRGCTRRNPMLGLRRGVARIGKIDTVGRRSLPRGLPRAATPWVRHRHGPRGVKTGKIAENWRAVAGPVYHSVAETAGGLAQGRRD